jgi:hypothetical protein
VVDFRLEVVFAISLFLSNLYSDLLALYILDVESLETFAVGFGPSFRV